MKPQLLKVPTGISNSFSIRQDMIPNINCNWHCHAELELIYFQKGHGLEFIGDNIKNFGKGDIVLIGSNLPHYFKYEEGNDKKINYESCIPYSTVIHFTENFWGDCFLNLPEAEKIKSLIKKAQRGILIKEKDSGSVKNQMINMCNVGGIERIIALLRCLTEFANSDKTELISSIGFNNEYNLSNSDRINSVYEYTLKNFRDTIHLSTVAAIAAMTVNSFCRYFKLKTGKSYLQFLNEIKVGYACKLLIDNRYNVKQICFESGFKNFTSFHEIFKKIKGRTPQQYFKEYSRSFVVSE